MGVDEPPTGDFADSIERTLRAPMVYVPLFQQNPIRNLMFFKSFPGDLDLGHARVTAAS